ncbi:hypothetical protein C8035_v001368 [Colletotrichum spinosum]|uniref:C2H2-type domain-containing protein n=1 Tax=Colletotrichum spinosum TaxID=1347390 RepID=A0A4R8Q8J3_9PEZI|nr:hypothetical protein C8035_v001368 [Colletotrichum spinosum]
MDPIKHLNCFKRFKLKRVKDVKQHLNRKHAAPENYCPRCWTIFEGRAQWDAHTRSTTCSGSAQRSEQLDVMTPGQQRDVAKRTDSILTEPDQWFSIWKILFPEKEAPQSPYLGTEMQEIIWTVQHCWAANSHQIVKDLVAARRRVPPSGEFSVAVSGNEVIGDGGIHQYTKEVLTDAMNMLLLQVEGKMDGMYPPQSPWLPAQEPSEAVTNFDVGSEISKDDEPSSLAVPGLFTSQTRGTNGAGEFLLPSDTDSKYLLSADTYSPEPFPAFPDDICRTPRALTSLESFSMDPAEFEQLPNLFDEPLFNQDTYSVGNEHEDW